MMLTVARLTVDTAALPSPRAPSLPASPPLSYFLSLYRSQVPMDAQISQEQPRSDSNLKFFMWQTTGVLLALKLPVLEGAWHGEGEGNRGLRHVR